MRLLLFNLATDADDPILGFTTKWIRALAERVEFIHVITMRAGRYELPGNVQVHSVGKEKGYSEPRRAFEFYRLLMRILREERIDACFSHMIPLFTVMAGLALNWRRIPIVTWYAHPHVTWILKLAHYFSAHMVASLRSAYPYKADKLIVTGQGIDTTLFLPDARMSPDDPPMILCVGRLSPVKDHPTLLKAVSLLRQNWDHPVRVVIVGGPATTRDDPYVLSLHQQVKQLGLEETVFFEPAVPMESLVSWYRRCAVYVNMTPTGSGDKVVWEVMSCGKLSLAANEGFRETFGRYADLLLFRHRDAEHLADRLRWALSSSENERQRIGVYLREQVVKMHSLDRLATTLVDLFARCVEKKSPRHALRVRRETTRSG
jgi:glycosyltransferase involved in cell wall biosynthesis